MFGFFTKNSRSCGARRLSSYLLLVSCSSDRRWWAGAALCRTIECAPEGPVPRGHTADRPPYMNGAALLRQVHCGGGAGPGGAAHPAPRPHRPPPSPRLRRRTSRQAGGCSGGGRADAQLPVVPEPIEFSVTILY